MSNKSSQTIHCPNCDGTDVVTVQREDTFSFRSGGHDYNVTATLPVRTCESCDEQFIDAEGEEVRHSAVCKALGRLTPVEIKSLRNRLGISRQEFADATGFGEASIARWENGDLIQSESNDTLMRLAAAPGVLARLISMRKNLERTQAISSRFQALPRSSQQLMRGKQEFQLRKATG